MTTVKPSMLAASSRLLTSAFGYGDSKPLESRVTTGKYASANTIAGRMKVPRRVLTLIAVELSRKRGKDYSYSSG